MRKILRGLVPKRRKKANLPSWERENLLFICTHKYLHFQFAYFKAPKEKGLAAPLTTFGWSPDTPARTACEINLPHLQWPQDETSAYKWITEWQKAFDVEKVTKKFYEDYEDVFNKLQQQIISFGDEEKRKMFTQTLMNRLLFLRFIERKGWLKYGDSNPKQYLHNLYQAGSIGEQSWYQSRLRILFFEGLAIPNHQKEDIIGNVPYLNGGLFEKTALDDKVDDIPNDAFKPILDEKGLFYRYNFTVEESTPLDIEVAVDPEMLGKVFEELVTARRERGSYYTPRMVVSFMCREALKGQLGTQYAALIDDKNTDGITVEEAKDLLAKLDALKIVDPACGSGAYLLGMLQELYRITDLLDTRAQTVAPHDAYQRKLSLIQKNLYGVDIDKFAINIARLRLWLSLAVDFEDDDPEPLPNLNFKIEIGDSLTAPDPSGGKQPDLIRQKQIEKFEELKAIHMNPVARAQHPGIDEEIKESREKIQIYAHPEKSIEGFDWRVEFAGVWSKYGGFDIVLANPPYGGARKGPKVKNEVHNLYFNSRSENEKGQSKDLYGLFIARGLQLLKQGGTLSYIVSDTWQTIKSHRPLRKRLLDNTTVAHVLNLPQWIFHQTVNTCVLTLNKANPNESHSLIAGDLRAIETGDWKALSDNLTAVSGYGPDIQTTSCARYTYKQCLINSYANLSFFIGLPKLFKFMNNTTVTTLEKDSLNIRTVEFNGKRIELVRLGDIADVKKGIDTGENNYFLYQNPEARGNYKKINSYRKFLLRKDDLEEITNNENLRKKVIENGFHKSRNEPNFDSDLWFEGRYIIPYDKGGESDIKECWLPQYYVPTDFYIDWSQDSVQELQKRTGRRSGNHKATIRNKGYWFKAGITFSLVGQYTPTTRLNSKSLFDNMGSSMFLKRFSIYSALGLLNSKFGKYLFKVYIDQTVAAQVDEFKEVPFYFNQNNSIIESVTTIIDKQQENLRYDYMNNEQIEIDQLVYEAYCLNEEDIREVELWYCRRYPKLAEAQGAMAEVKEKYAVHLARCEKILEKPPSYWKRNPTLELISQGESHCLEFKETLQYNTYTEETDKDVLHSSLKTIAAFLNTDGGTLLIGVSDDSEIKGLDKDLQFVHKHNVDGFEQKLRSLLNDRFEPTPLGKVEVEFLELQDGTICRVDVQSANDITHLDNEVYIRDGNRTKKLEGPDLTKWIQQRNSK
ncbi:Eco57I restriction-modification methylase domain-containing protein [Planctomycetota bacterium]